MNVLRRSTLGGVLAAFVYFAYACAAGNEEPRLGFDEDAGASDAAKDVAKVTPKDSGNEDDSGEVEEDSGATCDGKVVINELMSQGGTATDEFVELYNPGACAVSMSGWKLTYRSYTGNLSPALHTFVAGTQIASKAFFVIGGSGFAGKKDATLGGGGMAALRGQVALVDGQGKVIDGVAYGTNIELNSDAGTYAEKAPAQAPDEGASIGRKTDGLDTDNNAGDFAKLTPHTAGAPNQ